MSGGGFVSDYDDPILRRQLVFKTAIEGLELLMAEILPQGEEREKAFETLRELYRLINRSLSSESKTL